MAASPNKTFGERIADALVEDSLLTTAQVEDLLVQQKKEGTRLLKLLLEKNLVGELDLLVCMGRVLNRAPVNLPRVAIPADVAGLIPREVAITHKVLPVSRLDNKLFLAMADPLNVLAMDDVKRLTKLDIVPMIASEKAIVDKINNLESSSKAPSMEEIIQESQRQAELEADADTVQISKEATDDATVDQIAASSEEAPVIKLANLILVQAIKDRASDIHIEPFEKMVRLRYRVDGALTDSTPPPKNLQIALTSRLKIMSNLDIAERRLPQDGQGCIAIGARDYHLRFSCIPAVNGESIVVRIIDDHAGLRSFEEMGVWPGDRERMEALLRQPSGLVYVTGPTGSGKTTLLYSMLHNLPARRINELKIVTLEEPVEVRHPRFFLQIDVDEKIGRTFGELLRHVLRHDPDVVLVGETRDRPTAEITLRAALTGRLCLSTLHTIDALGAINRLADIGLDPLMLASALKGVIAQRLVRSPCARPARDGNPPGVKS